MTDLLPEGDRARLLSLTPPDQWHNVGDPLTGLGTIFVATWANLGGRTKMGFRKSADGTRVELKGEIGGGASSAQVTTLPVGYRPKVNKRLQAGGWAVFQGLLYVQPDGFLSVWYPAGNTEAYLDNCSFSLDAID